MANQLVQMYERRNYNKYRVKTLHRSMTNKTSRASSHADKSKENKQKEHTPRAVKEGQLATNRTSR